MAAQDLLWMLNAFGVRSTDGYKDAPFAWGAPTTSVMFIGQWNDMVSSLTSLREAFGDVTWVPDERENWSDDVIKEYTPFLKQYYSISALRALCAVHNINAAVGADTEERPVLVDRLCAAHAPLHTPAFLKAYVTYVRSVASDTIEGHTVFSYSGSQDSPQPAVGQPGEESNVLEPERHDDGNPQGELASLRLQLQQHQAAAAAATAAAAAAPVVQPAAVSFTEHQLKALFARLAPSGEEALKASPTKAKAGWKNVIHDAKTALGSTML